MRRIIACILLLTFSVSVGCTAHRWKPVEPQPRSDAVLCKDLVGKEVYLQLADQSTVRFLVTACDYPRIRGTVVSEAGGSAAADTLSYDLWAVTVVAESTEVKHLFATVLIIGLGVVVVLGVLFIDDEDFFSE